MIGLNEHSAKLVLEDIISAGGPNDRHETTIVETDYGLLSLGHSEHALPILAVDYGSRAASGWHFAWTTLDDIRDYPEDNAFTVEDVWKSAAMSTTRYQVSSRPRTTWEHTVQKA